MTVNLNSAATNPNPGEREMTPEPVPPPVPVAIIGMSCLFPGAGGLAGYWSSIRRKHDAITEVPATHWRVDDYYDPDPKAPDRTYARRGGFLDPVAFPAMEFGIAPHNLEATDTTQLLGLYAARAALEDAGYGEGIPNGRPLDRSRVSVILGVTGTLELVIPLGARLGHPIWRRALKAAGIDSDTAETVVRQISDGYVGWQENSFPGLLGNVAAGRIANRLDLGGTNCVVDAACAARWPPSTWRSWSSPPAAATWRYRAASIHLMTFLCTCVLARPRRCRRRVTRGRSTRRETGRSWERVWGSWS